MGEVEIRRIRRKYWKERGRKEARRVGIQTRACCDIKKAIAQVKVGAVSSAAGKRKSKCKPQETYHSYFCIPGEITAMQY
jgi:hypothetical protein